MRIVSEPTVTVSSDGGTTFILWKPRRQTHAKSHAGCFNCKRRRVKCNEAKPACKHCARRGEICSYPSDALPQHLKVTGHDGAMPEDGTLWLHFAETFTNANNGYCIGEPRGPWLDDILALSLESAALFHAIIGCARSHVEIKKPSPRDGAALSRRCRAIQQLSAELNPANRNSPSRCHWAIATCIVLRIQSGFLDDGMLDSLITLRLTFALTKLHFPTHLRSNHVATVQHVLGPEQPSALSELRTVHPRIVKAGIMSLARVRVPPSDIILQRFHDDLTECFPLFLAGIDFALGGFRRLYRSILTMPEDAFLAVFDSNTPVAQCLVAHWLALSLLVNAFVIGMSVEGHRTAVGKGPAWIAMLSSDLGTSDLWSASFRWPINLMRSIDLLDQERSGSDGPTTSAQLLAKILQRPETFAAG